MDKKNICIVNENQPILGVGGVETVTYILSLALKDIGYNTYNLFLKQKGTLSSNDMLLNNSQNVYSKENLQKFTEYIKKWNISIILCQGYTTELFNLCKEAKSQTNTKLVFVFHRCPYAWELDYDDYKERLLETTKSRSIKLVKGLFCEFKRPIYRKQARKLAYEFFKGYDIKSIDAFVTLHKDYSNYIKRFFGKAYHSRFHSIPNPVLASNCNTKGNNKENIILFVARLTKQKRLDRLLRIWKELQDNYSNWRIVVVGDGEYANEYKRIAAELQLRHIEFVGQQPAEEYYKKSRILCMTSSHEGFGMVLAEAQLWNCVPLSYKSFATTSDLIIDGYNGLLIKPYSKRHYVRALKYLFENESERRKMAENGKDYIKRFESSVIAEKWNELFIKII